MARKMNNSRLLIVLLVLIAVFFGVKYFNSSKVKGNFDPNLVSIDTASIQSVSLFPQSAKGEEIILKMDGNNWMVQNGDKKVKAMQSVVEGLINGLLNIKPTRLAATNSEKWEAFQVTDSAASKVEVNYKDGSSIAILIGKFSYKQNPNPSQYQQQQGQAISYFRIDGSDEVYACDGFLSMTFNRDFNAFRDQTFLKVNKENITSLKFQMPADSGYVIQKLDSVWTLGNEPLNQEKVNTFLSQLTSNNQSQFEDDFKVSSSVPYNLTIQGDNMESIEIESYPFDSLSVIMISSLNKEAKFKVSKNGFFKELFKGSDYFKIQNQN